MTDLPANRSLHSPASNNAMYAGKKEISLLGYRVTPLSGSQVIEEVAAAVAERRRLVMANINLHAMAAMFDSPQMARLMTQSDSRVMLDSMPMLFLANILGHSLPRSQRATSLDFYDDMFRLGLGLGWKFGFVGAAPDVLKAGLCNLQARHPGLDIDGRHGNFDLSDERRGSHQAEIIDWLHRRNHDVVIVGMGMPRQEEWICRVQDRISTRVLLPAGAYLDYQVGAQRKTPRWIGQIGMEWAYRLAASPQRLGHRYLVEPFILAQRLITRPHPQRPTLSH